MSNGVKRDLESMNSRKFHAGTERPLWAGPIPNKYYYVVRGIPFKPGSMTFPRFETPHHYISVSMGSKYGLLESELPLPIKMPEGKMIRHSKVDLVKSIFWESMDRSSPILSPEDDGVQLEIKGRPITEEEVFI